METIDVHESVDHISGYNLFQSVVWKALTEQEREDISLWAIAEGMQSINIDDGRGENTPIKHLARVWRHMPEDKKLKWKEIHAILPKNWRPPRWGNEQFIDNDTTFDVLHSLRLSYRRCYQQLLRAMHVQLNKPDTKTAYRHRQLRIPEKIFRKRLVVIRWNICETLFELKWKPKLHLYFTGATRSGVPIYKLEDPNVIESIFSYHGRVASKTSKRGMESKVGVKIQYDKHKIGYALRFEAITLGKQNKDDIFVVQTEGESESDAVISMTRGSIDKITPLIIKYHTKTQTMEIIFARFTLKDGSLLVLQSS